MKLNCCDLIPGAQSYSSPSHRGRACDSVPRPDEAGQRESPSSASSFEEVAGGLRCEDRSCGRPEAQEGECSGRVGEDTAAARPDDPDGPAQCLTRPTVPVWWSEALLQPLSETDGASLRGPAPAGFPSALEGKAESGIVQGIGLPEARGDATQAQIPNGTPGPSLPAEGLPSAAFADSKQTAPASLTAEPIRAESMGGVTGRPADPGPAGLENQTGPLPGDFEQSDLPKDPGTFLEERGAGSREKALEQPDPETLLSSARKGPQSILEPPAADARKFDTAAPEAVMPQGAGKASAVEDSGRQTETPLRTHSGPGAPSAEAKSADPAHPCELKGTFDASGKTAHLKIQDQGLGAMQWHLRMEGGRLAAEAIVQSPRIQEIFQANQDVLQSRLDELGVELEGFEVSVDQGSQGFFGRGFEKGAVPPVQGQGRDAVTGAVGAHVQANVTALARGGVDLYA